MCIKNRSVLSTEPWGTPHCLEASSETTPLIHTNWALLGK